MKRLLFSLVLFTVLTGVWGLEVTITQAADPIVPCGTGNAVSNGLLNNECTFCNLQVLAVRFVHTVILIAVAFTAVLFANAGYLYIMSSANPGNISKGHRLFSSALTGFLVVLCAWLIIELIMSTFIDTNTITNWRNILCDTQYIHETDPVAIPSIPHANGPGYTSAQMTNSTTNPKGQVLTTAALTQGIQRLENNCTTAGGQSCADYIRQQAIARGIDPNFALAVAAVESGGMPNPGTAISPAGAYGVMQLKPETAIEMCGAPCAGMSNDQMRTMLLNDPAKNIDYGLSYIQKAESYVTGNLAGASQIDPARTNDYIVAYYNGGPGALQPSNDCGSTQTKYECTINPGGYVETQNYVSKMNTYVNSVNSATEIAAGG